MTTCPFTPPVHYQRQHRLSPLLLPATSCRFRMMMSRSVAMEKDRQIHTLLFTRRDSTVTSIRTRRGCSAPIRPYAAARGRLQSVSRAMPPGLTRTGGLMGRCSDQGWKQEVIGTLLDCLPMIGVGFVKHGSAVPLIRAKYTHL